jgi:uncharacterized protein CbrC (UPF0167 family)
MTESKTLVIDFPYHPKPLESGYVVPSNKICCTCGKSRGFIYTTDPFKEPREDERAPCPWCIEDGSYSSSFEDDHAQHDEDQFAPYVDLSNQYLNSFKSQKLNQSLFHLLDEEVESSPKIPEEIREKVVQRTPHFLSWKEPEWLIHCDDACEFVGHFDTLKVKESEKDLYKAVFRACMRECAMLRVSEEQLKKKATELLETLRTSDPSAVVFRCRKCRKYLSYIDFS